MDKRIIFLPTVQSTGTWFCIELIKKHSAIDYFSVVQEINHNRLDSSMSLIQAHFGKHLENGLSDEEIKKWISEAHKTIVPLRDPLRAILTAHVRDAEASHNYIVDGFLTLAGWKENVFYVPVDLYAKESPEVRLDFLHRLFDYLELTREEYLNTWAEEWPVHNTVGERLGTEVNKMYQDGDVQKISETVPESYEYLLSNKETLRPFLESAGYKNLLWWN